jgi:hypothetical protein
VSSTAEGVDRSSFPGSGVARHMRRRPAGTRANTELAAWHTPRDPLGEVLEESRVRRTLVPPVRHLTSKCSCRPPTFLDRPGLSVAAAADLRFVMQPRLAGLISTSDMDL